jgi:hypothetical protein
VRDAQARGADARADIEHAQRPAGFARDGGGEHHCVEPGTIAGAQLPDAQRAVEKRVVGDKRTILGR